MSFFAKGEFNLKESWEEKKPNSRERERNKEGSLLANAAKNAMNVFENPPNHDILDDRMSKRILDQFNMEKNIDTPASSKSIGKPTSKLPPKGKNEDLLSSMAARLTKLQQTCTSQRSELKEKSETIDRLKSENDLYKEAKSNPNSLGKQMEELRGENDKLKTKVEQMEKFLKSYGLKWVGNKIEGQFDKKQLDQDLKKPKYNYRLPSEIDIRTVATRIDELNIAMHKQGNSSSEVYKDNDGIHKIRKAQPLLIGFFADGISIKGYPFYSYKSKESLQVLADILDGYFPYILKSKYPNGVFMKVVDKTEVKYVDSLEGDRIGSLEGAEEKQLKPPTKQQFLQKLPKQIVKDGKLIPIRDAIEKKLDGIKKQQSSQYYTEDEHGIATMATPVQAQFEAGKVKQQDICTLKVRTESGRICILRLKATASMKEVYLWMRRVADSKQFTVVGNYPKRHYLESESENLSELGLTPNSALHLQPPEAKKQ